MVHKIREGVWELRAPDDMHCHLRDTEVGDPHSRLSHVVGHTARQFARAIAMPNTKPPIRNAMQLVSYRDRMLRAAAEAGFPNFQPLMVLYITEETTPEDICMARNAGAVAGKFYPQGGTTGAADGVRDFGERMFPVYEAMETVGMRALFHGADPDPKVDLFDRELRFLPTFKKIAEQFPELRMVLEHMSTHQAVSCVLSLGDNVFGSITALHLHMNRNDLMGSGLNPSMYAFPPLQAEEHRQSLIEAAVTGSPKFFAGTDSAPHFGTHKYCECGAMGAYTACNAVELYAEIFEETLGDQGEALWVGHLEDFLSRYGAEAYGLPLNEGKMVLSREPQLVPKKVVCGDNDIIPLRYGETLRFRARLAV